MWTVNRWPIRLSLVSTEGRESQEHWQLPGSSRAISDVPVRSTGFAFLAVRETSLLNQSLWHRGMIPQSGFGPPMKKCGRHDRCSNAVEFAESNHAGDPL